ncbi:multiple sugar transport system permease protein [Actinoplanes lutulentus]|uniref:Carbohydrate ABC transporter membrane protein 1 (CUT1 family) n=1 Tax=Actinoplanes lutulentus TaxID=1287878 RepID=A0A327YZY3_9ACTN|nr:sugar ABC transporter permease [Actinoplanes lutulentus]MBB2943603.1 multiple sugar transport system permease protein [Actinoplanes lutulentus]RAK27468.1 carbohydrate ABC transporter membrane protein 1 (CUT1 family) [Actinoplanes lutulentus]
MAPATTLEAPPEGAVAPPGAIRKRRKPQLAGWAYAAPTALFVLIFFIVPILLVGQMSISDWGLFAGNRGINAPENFTKVIDDRLFWPAVWFTLKYTVVTTVILLGLALGLAMLVQEASRWTGFLRTSFLVPSALGLASASLLFYALYSPQSTPLKFLGIDSFLGTPSAALWSTVALIVWRFAGFYMLLLLVGLQGISGDVYEAARLDGAGRWQTFRYVTLPLLRSSIALCTILCVTGSMLAFDQFYILTKGGPDNSTITIVQLVYNMAFFGQNNLGKAAALSILVLVALLVVNVLQFRGLRDKES